MFTYDNYHRFVLFFSIYVVCFSSFTGCSNLPDRYGVNDIFPDQQLVNTYHMKIKKLNEKESSIFANDEIAIVNQKINTVIKQVAGNAITAQIAASKNLKEIKTLLKEIDQKKDDFIQKIQQKCQKFDSQMKELLLLNLDDDIRKTFHKANDLCALVSTEKPYESDRYAYSEIKKIVQKGGETIGVIRKKILNDINLLLPPLDKEISKEDSFYSDIPLTAKTNCLNELNTAKTFLTTAKKKHSHQKTSEASINVTKAKQSMKKVIKEVLLLAKNTINQKQGKIEGQYLSDAKNFYDNASQYLEKHLFIDALKNGKKAVIEAEKAIPPTTDYVLKTVDSIFASIRQRSLFNIELIDAEKKYIKEKDALLNQSDTNLAFEKIKLANKTKENLKKLILEPIYRSKDDLNNLPDNFKKYDIKTLRRNVQEIKTAQENDPLTLTIEKAVRYRNNFQSYTSPIFRHIDRQFNQSKNIMQKVFFLINEKKIKKISVLSSEIQNLYSQLENKDIYQKFRFYKDISHKLKKIMKYLNQIKPMQTLLILEAADSSNRPRAFIAARKAIVSYLNEKKEKGITNDRLSLDVFLAYDEKVYKLDGVKEVAISHPNPQASSTVHKQLEHSLSFFNSAGGIKRIIYLIPSNRSVIINDRLISLLDISRFKNKKISINCIFLGDSDISVLNNLAEITNGETYKCKTENQIKEKIIHLIKQ